MEFTQEFIESHNLTTEQIDAITKHYDSEVIPSIKKEYDGLANKNAEAILDGATKAILNKFEISEERQQGEKIADFLTRIVDKPFEKAKSDLEKKSKELADKLANFKGGDEYKAQVEKLTNEKEELLKKVADLEPLKGLDEKYKEASEQLSGLKLNVAFNNIKPAFPKEVNEYEAKAKWEDFKNTTLTKYNIELDDNNVAYAVEKENHYKRIPLKDLLNQDTQITELLKGRQQQGTGSKPTSYKDVEGVPFQVPEGANIEELTAIVREHLTKELGSTLHTQYASKFAELMAKIRKTA